jgi:predicted GIY-YIG superfamily endonuclease
MKYYVYMLLLRNGTIYVGYTNDLNRRLTEHATARGSHATKDSRPIRLLHSEELPDRVTAARRERQIKGWTRAKKLALARGNLDQLHRLAKRRS